MSIDFSDLPEETRVKLTEEGTDELWHRVNEFGGVKRLSEAFDFSASKMYNWKNKGGFLPIKFVKRLMGENPSKIKSVKGKGRGKEWEARFPIPENAELLTRVQESVKVNEKQVPFYITGDSGLYSRFQQLLDDLNVPYKSYSRDRYEVRYPKYVHRVFRKMNYQEDLAALVDEIGSIEDDCVRARDKRISASGFDGELYSRDKKLELAIARNDADMIQQLISEESSKVRNMIRN
ncbi:MAG: hypothetical protein ACI977_000097 [Candidatus Nanohaloarchaea archaeon]|jgi:hypothetical protein